MVSSGGGNNAQATHDRRMETMMAQVSRQLALLTQTVQIFEERLRVVESQVQKADDSEQRRGDPHGSGAGGVS